MFAKHRQGTTPAHNCMVATQSLTVLDFSGFEATPFLNQQMGLNLNKLMAPGLGIKGTLDSGAAFTVYYFSETAYRFVVESSAVTTLEQFVANHVEDYDIELVVRDDLAITTLSGSQAFDTLISSFELTPGLRLSDELVCYGRQSGEVFVTSLLEEGEQRYQLIAQQPTLDKWQAALQAQGFNLN
jgi:aminomethyltransferase